MATNKPYVSVSPEWRKLGALIGLSGSQLQALSVKHLNDIQLAVKMCSFTGWRTHLQTIQ